MSFPRGMRGRRRDLARCGEPNRRNNVTDSTHCGPGGSLPDYRSTIMAINS